MFASARATRMLKATRNHRRARSSRAGALCNRLPMKARQIKTAAATATPPIPTSTASSAKPKKIALLDHGFRRRAPRLFCKGNGVRISPRPTHIGAPFSSTRQTAGIEHPQHPGIEPRRVWHGEILGDDAVGLHVDQGAAFMTALAPAIDNIAARHAFLHG